MQTIPPIDPVVIEVPFIPHQSQKQFLDEAMFYDWRAALGGTGSGKSYLGAFELIRLCTLFPGIETVAFSPTYGMVKRNIIPILRTLLGGSIDNSPLVDRFHKGDMVIYWRNGSTTWLNSLEYPERAEGQSLDLVWVDEARLVRHLDLALMVIQRRLRGSPTGKLIGFQPRAYLTTTPDYPGSELHGFCEDPLTRHPSLKVIRMPLMDNKGNLPSNYVDNIIRAHTGGLAEQFVHGRFAMVETGSFAFDYTKHVVLNLTYNPEVHRRILYGVDFGWNNPSAIIVIGFDGDDRAYVLDEYYKNMTSIDELAQEFLDPTNGFYKLYGKGTAYCDPTEKQTVETMKQKGINARPCLIKRDDGIRSLGGRFQLQGDQKYRIYISSNCVNTISELQTYNSEKKERDHAVDAIRYVVSSRRSMGPLQAKKVRTKW